MAKPAKQYTFTVTGTGLFPFDMLRYDSCWPAHETDSAQIEATTRRVSRGPVDVGVRGLHEPTEERWRSFGWRVSNVRPDEGVI